MGKKPLTLKQYQRGPQDAAEDKRNAKKRGESVAAWKKTKLAVDIDRRDLKKLNAKRKRAK